jgi:hypothetical protein
MSIETAVITLLLIASLAANIAMAKQLGAERRKLASLKKA